MTKIPRRNLPVVVMDRDQTPSAIQVAMDFQPSEDMMRIRAEYQALCEENPLDLRPTLEKVVDYLTSHRASMVLTLAKANPSFLTWFEATHEFNARVKYLGDKALRALEQLLDSEHPAAANAKVKAASMILDMIGKSKPTDNPEDKLMKSLSKLDAAQCQALLSNGSEVKVSIKRNKAIEAEEVSSDDNKEG
jgi:hypothetical protein